MRTATFVCLAMVLPALAGCGRDRAPAAAPPPPRAQVLRDVPVYPGSMAMDTTGTLDAEQRRFAVAARFDSVTAFYRGRLPALRWQFMGGRSDSTQLDMLAQRGDTNLWLHIEKAGEHSSQYTLIASVVRKAEPADSGR